MKIFFILFTLCISISCSGLQRIEYNNNKYSVKDINPYIVYEDFYCTFYNNHTVKDKYDIIFNFFASMPQNDNVICNSYDSINKIGIYKWKVEHQTLYIGITYVTLFTYNEIHTDWYSFEVLKQIITCYKLYYIIEGDKNK